MLGVGEGELGTELSLLPKNRSGSGEVDSAGTFHGLVIAWVGCNVKRFQRVGEGAYTL